MSIIKYNSSHIMAKELILSGLKYLQEPTSDMLIGHFAHNNFFTISIIKEVINSKNVTKH